MNDIKIFENAEFGSVRTVEVNGEPYFIGKDICMVFGDKNHNRSLSRVDNDDKTTVEITDSMGRKQLTTAVNESGLYSLMFTMQPQKANKDGVSDAYPIEVQQRIDKLHKFKHWVTSEVLPSIRKHGAYMTDEALHRAITEPDFLIQLANELKEEKQKRKVLEAKVEQDKPLVLFADSVQTSHTSILVGELAKILKRNGVDIGQKRLFEWLRTNGYLMKSGSSRNIPTQYAMEHGWFEIKESSLNMPDGSIRVTKTTKVTGKGQIYFVNRFLNKGKEQ